MTIYKPVKAANLFSNMTIRKITMILVAFCIRAIFFRDLIDIMYKQKIFFSHS